jgi:hypothetical protein
MRTVNTSTVKGAIIELIDGHAVSDQVKLSINGEFLWSENIQKANMF